MSLDAIVTVGWKVLAVLVLVALNGFFVAAEFALVKIRDTQLTPLIARGQRRARLALHLVHNLDAYLSAAQLGITLASLGLGWIGEPIFAALLAPVFKWLDVASPAVQHAIAFGVGFSVITFLHITVGEQAPKSFAIKQPLPTSLFVAYPLHWFYLAAFPFIWALNHSSLWVLRRVGIEPVHEAEGLHSEDELRLLFAAAQRKAGGTPLGREIVINALDLRHRIVREVMRPRQEIAALSTAASMEDCLDVAEKTRYSRFPLCEDGNLDRTVGVVHIKDIYARRLRVRTGAELAAVASRLIYVPETARLEKLLGLFLQRKLHLAIVVDEYGGTVGLITLENILEELVGQIQDEFDQEKPLLSQTGDHLWALDGALPLHQLEELTGERLAGEGITTSSGWVTHRLGGFPKEGDSVAVGAFDLRVEELDGPRVARLVLTRRPETDSASVTATEGAEE